MSLTIGGVDFDIAPLNSDPSLDDLYDYLFEKPVEEAPLYRWSCVSGTGTDQDGIVQAALDCEVYVIVVERAKSAINPKKRIKKSDALAARVRKLTGLKTKKLIAGVRKAIGAVQITLDVRSVIQKYGEDVSFQVNVSLFPLFFVLRPKGGPKDTYIVVGVPLWCFFSVSPVVPCKGRITPPDFPYAWYPEVTPNDAHTTWERQFNEHAADADKRWKKRIDARNKLRGVKKGKSGK